MQVISNVTKESYIDSLLLKLRQLCERAYKFHCYYGRDGVDNYAVTQADMDNIKKIFQEIIQTQWTDNNNHLGKVKAESYYQLGSVYKEMGDYEQAVKYLKKAESNIQKESLQNIIPIIYIRTEICLAECYIEKHCTFSMIDECHKEAEKTLKKRLRFHRYEYETISARLELTLQQAIAEIDPFGQKRQNIKNAQWKYLKSYKENTENVQNTQNNKQNTRKNKNIKKETTNKKKQKNTEHTKQKFSLKQKFPVYGYLKQSRQSFNEIKLLPKQDQGLYLKEYEDSIIATEANFLKALYFDLRNLWMENKSLKNTKITKKDYSYFDIIVKILNNYSKDFSSNKNEKKILKTIQKKTICEKKLLIAYLLIICYRILFDMFSEGVDYNDKSTICLGNLVILLYDYKTVEKANRYLKYTLNDYNNYRPNSLPSFTKEDLKSDNIFEEKIDEYLRMIYKTEANNMFALNINACLKYKRPIDIEGNIYSTLRHSSLKRYFKRLDQYIPNMNDCPIFMELKLRLILFYNDVISYMEKAVVDVNSEQWKGKLVGHYTNVNVLSKLINNKKNSRLHLSNVRHLNDPAEGILFVNQTFEKTKCNFVNDIIDAYSLKNQGTYRSSVYMGSFTTQYDQLTMWSRYGNSGKGISLQLDVSESFDSNVKVPLEFAVDDEQVVIMEDKRYPLYIVLYLPSSKISQNTLEELIEYSEQRSLIERNQDEREWWKTQKELLGYFKELKKNLNDNLLEIGKLMDMLNTYSKDTVSFTNEVKNTVMIILDLVRFLVKSEHYKDEREYRLIQYSSDPKYEEMEDNTPRLYIDLEKKLAYKRICYGPCVADFNSTAAHGINIRKQKKDGKRGDAWNLQSYQSQIAYNGEKK